MYVVSSGSVEWASQGNYQGYSLSLPPFGKHISCIISFLWVALTKNFLEFLFNLEINQWGSGRWEAFLRPQEDDQICISQLNY